MKKSIEGESPILALIPGNNRRMFSVEIYPDQDEAWISLEGQTPNRMQPDKYGRVLGFRGNNVVTVWIPRMGPYVNLEELSLDGNVISETRKLLRSNGFIVNTRKLPSHVL